MPGPFFRVTMYEEGGFAWVNGAAITYVRTGAQGVTEIYFSTDTPPLRVRQSAEEVAQLANRARA